MSNGILIYKTAAGRTPPGATDWKQYSDGIYVDVDTSAAGFGERSVIYTTSLAGEKGHWLTTGGSCIYSPTNKGFRIYVKYISTVTPQDANSWNWHINWIGIEVS
jgi:hypothetical protein